MEKTVFTHEYDVLRDLLRQTRTRAGLTQEEVGKRIGETQSFVSKCERGERRLDLVQLRFFCQAIGTSLPKFVAAFEERAGKGRRR